MDFSQDLTFAEKEIRKIADIKHIPIAGTFELTPLCNMDCQMCYVRMDKSEIKKSGQIKTANEWIKLGEKAVEQGMMFLLLTGGEPFLYPNFSTVYKELRNMGLIIMINSNGTLLTNDILNVLAQNKPRRINLSLYGSNNHIYNTLCRNPKGFTQLIDCVERLQAYNIDIRFNMTVTPWNKADLPNMIELAKQYNVPVTITNYIFPATRRSLTCEQTQKHRFSPELAGEYDVEISKLYETKEEFILSAKEKISSVRNAQLPEKKQQNGFWCRGGNSSFWITWDWRMLPCGMVNHPATTIMDAQCFESSWLDLRTKMDSILLSSKCYTCSKRSICQSCAAAMITETGSYSKSPEYLCHMTNSLLKTYVKYLEEFEHE